MNIIAISVLLFGAILMFFTLSRKSANEDSMNNPATAFALALVWPVTLFAIFVAKVGS